MLSNESPHLTSSPLQSPLQDVVLLTFLRQHHICFQRNKTFKILQQPRPLADVLSHNCGTQHNPCSPSKFPITLGLSSTAALVTHAVWLLSSVFLPLRFLLVFTFQPLPPVPSWNKRPTHSYSPGFWVLHILLFDWLLHFLTPSKCGKGKHQALLSVLRKYSEISLDG